MAKKTARPVIRPATREDLDKFYNGKFRFQFTTIAMVGLVRGRVVGVGGVAYVDGKLVAFAEFKPSARRYKVTIVKAAILAIEQAKAAGARFIWARADPREPGAVRWMTSLGFKPTNMPQMYRWARD